MYSIIARTLSLAGLCALGVSSPLGRRDIATFPAGTVWDIVLEGSKTDLAAKISARGTVIDIDLEDNWKNGSLTTIKELAAAKKKVICYFSAGTREDWRDDDYKFKPEDYGKAMGPQWPGEWWLDVTSENVRTIMRERIEAAAKAGCHAVDPDNVDGYSEDDNNVPHQDGFQYDSGVYAEYVRYLAKIARENNLAIGLKNAQDIIPDVINVIQFAVNEQCHETKECAVYKNLTTANLAVFNIEYNTKDCSDPPGVNLSTVLKSPDQGLSALGGQC